MRKAKATDIRMIWRCGGAGNKRKVATKWVPGETIRRSIASIDTIITYISMARFFLR